METRVNGSKQKKIEHDEEAVGDYGKAVGTPREDKERRQRHDANEV